jgi:hypothetical protein
VGDDLCALGHLGQGVRGQDRVDLGREVEAGCVGLHEADVGPAVRLYPVLGTGEHRIGQIDADDPTTGTDRLLKQRKFRPVPQAMSITVSPMRRPSSSFDRHHFNIADALNPSFEHARGDCPHDAMRSTSIHIMASVRSSSAGLSSIPQRAADVPIGPANAIEVSGSTTVTS